MAPNREEIQTQARKLAVEHRKTDPELKSVYVSTKTTEEVRLLEVSGSAGTTGDVIPLRFKPRPPILPLATVLVLVSPEEYERLQDGSLDLPEDWGELSDLEPIEIEDGEP